MSAKSHRLKRLAAARAAVEAFPAFNHPQRQLQALLLQMLDTMRSCCWRPGGEAELRRWWPAVTVYLEVLASPAMDSKRARRLLPRVLDVPWSGIPDRVRRVAGLDAPASRTAPRPKLERSRR